MIRSILEQKVTLFLKVFCSYRVFCRIAQTVKLIFVYFNVSAAEHCHYFPHLFDRVSLHRICISRHLSIYNRTKYFRICQAYFVTFSYFIETD